MLVCVNAILDFGTKSIIVLYVTGFGKMTIMSHFVFREIPF